MKRKIIVSFSIILVIVLGIIYYFKSNNLKKKENQNKIETEKLNKFSSNIIENVKYSTKDINGNEYIITARVGEIGCEAAGIGKPWRVRASWSEVYCKGKQQRQSISSVVD